MEIRHLRAICAIADLGSVSQAAAALGISQPSLTTLLQRIERQIGAPLFSRNHSGVTPTSIGERTVRQARVLLLEFDRFEADVHRRADGGPLRFGSTQMDCLPAVIDLVEDAFAGPEITVLVESSGLALAQAVARGAVDVAVIAMSDDEDVPLAKHLGQRILVPWIPVFVGLSAGHRLAGRPEVALADLAEEAWIGPPGSEDGSLTSFRAAAQRAGFVPRIQFECPTGGGRQLIAAGKAIQLLEPTAPELPGTVVRPLVDDPLRLRIVLAWHKERLSWEQAEHVHRAATAAYTRHAMASAPFRSWWDRRRKASSLDSFAGFTATPG
jgi:DNA-binding transcriptional LysR family regulator